MGHRNLDLGRILELGLPVGIPFLMVGYTNGVHGVLRLTVWGHKVIYQPPSTKWRNAARHKNDRPVAQVDKLNIDPQGGMLWHVSPWDVLLDVSYLCHKMLLFCFSQNQ